MARNPQPIRPRVILARLVYQTLTDIEYHSQYHEVAPYKPGARVVVDRWGT